MLTRDYIFEFAGMPKSGKTTIFDIVSHYLKRSGIKIEEYHGGGRYSPIDKSALASLNMFLAGRAVEFILVSAERERIGHRIFLMDRGVYDRCIFTIALQRMGKVDLQETDATLNYLTLPRIAQRIDGVFLFVTDPEISISREYKNKLVEVTGRVMNTDFLEILRSISLGEVQKMQQCFSNVQIIDTKELDGKLIECARVVADSIMAKIGVTND
jgi:thymidylate kinase